MNIKYKTVLGKTSVLRADFAAKQFLQIPHHLIRNSNLENFGTDDYLAI